MDCMRNCTICSSGMRQPKLCQNNRPNERRTAVPGEKSPTRSQRIQFLYTRSDRLAVSRDFFWRISCSFESILDLLWTELGEQRADPLGVRAWNMLSHPADTSLMSVKHPLEFGNFRCRRGLREVQINMIFMNARD